MTDQTNQPANDGGAGPASLPLFYKNPKPLEPGMPGASGLKKATSMAFAAATNVIPITISEFSLAQKYYPIAFSPGEVAMPVAFVGLNDKENLFIDENGHWEANCYIPAFVRRYPFIMGEDRTQGKAFLCVDAGSELVTDEDPDQTFYDGSEPSDFLKQAFEFCRQYQDDVMLTQAFGNELHEKKLLHEIELHYQVKDKGDLAGRLISIDNAAFEKLGNDAFLDFRTRGLLPLIYFQLASLNNWGQLGARWEKRNAAAAPSASGASND